MAQTRAALPEGFVIEGNRFQNTSPGVLYRRNGQPQSCEPCRKSKKRCDHAVPICSRCVKRRRGADCVYHPQPMTQPRGERRKKEVARNKSHNIAVSSTPVHNSTQQSNQAEEDVRRQKAPLDGTREYLGPTSYSDVLLEGLDDFNHLLGTHSATPVDPSEPTSLSATQVADGCRALEFLANRSPVDKFVRAWIDAEEVALTFPRPVMRIWLSDLWRVHFSALGGRPLGRKRELCHTIWRNTRTSIPFHKETSLQEWSRSATGTNIRWEVIGLIAITYAFYIASPHATHHELLQNGLMQSSVTADLLRVSEACISFCQQAGSCGDLFVCLAYEHSRLVRALMGCTSFRTYNSLGESVSAVFALGLHKRSTAQVTSAEAPLFLKEIRRRLFVSVYAAEISMALFVGRPPRISSRYCDFEAPLALTDDQLALPTSDLSSGASDLRDGSRCVQPLYQILRLQAWARIGLHREEVLELSLVEHDTSHLVERAIVIEQKMRDDWLSMPERIRAPVSDPGRRRTYGVVETIWTTMLKIDYMTTNLVLQRVLVQKTGSGAAKLISVAQEILSDIKAIANSHEIAHAAQTDYMGFLTHGLSSAAVLAVELLKQERSAPYPLRPLLPRSQTIQELSEFIAMLKSVDRSNVGYPMCEQSHRAISHILDRILTRRPGEREQTAENENLRGLCDERSGEEVFGPLDGFDADHQALMPLTEDSTDWLKYLNTDL